MLDKFASTVPMSPYLVAVAITDYVALPSPDNRWPGISTHYPHNICTIFTQYLHISTLYLHNSTSVWAPREDIEAGRGDFANSIGAEIMRKAVSPVIVSSS